MSSKRTHQTDLSISIRTGGDRKCVTSNHTYIIISIFFTFLLIISIFRKNSRNSPLGQQRVDCSTVHGKHGNFGFFSSFIIQEVSQQFMHINTPTLYIFFNLIFCFSQSSKQKKKKEKENLHG